MEIPNDEKVLAALRARSADALALAKNARLRGDDSKALQADEIANEWRRLIKRAGGGDV